MKRIAVLVSGRGSNLQALIDAQAAGALGGEIVVVVSNVAHAPALERASRAGIETLVLEHQGLRREDFDRGLVACLGDRAVDVVCLAGFMRILSPLFVRAFGGRILNIHPSLLPAFAGQDAQAQALAHGVKLTGATVHLVDEGLDSGPILIQEAVPVRDDDTLDSLSARILEVEHRIYPRALRLLCERHMRLDGRRAILEVP